MGVVGTQFKTILGQKRPQQPISRIKNVTLDTYHGLIQIYKNLKIFLCSSMVTMGVVESQF